MTDAEFTAVCGRITSMIQDDTPNPSMNKRDKYGRLTSTGNLAFNATRYESLGANKIRIYVNTVGVHAPQSQDGIAPYFVYVNGYQTLWEKPNPNYGYWGRAIDRAIHNIAASYRGSVTIV